VNGSWLRWSWPTITGWNVLPDDQIDLLMDFALSLAGRISTVLVERGRAEMHRDMP